MSYLFVDMSALRHRRLFDITRHILPV